MATSEIHGYSFKYMYLKISMEKLHAQIQSIVSSAPLSLEGNPNTSVTSRQKNLKHD